MLQSIPNEKFRKIDSFIKQLVDDKKIPGALLLLSKNENTEFLQKYGWQDVENSIPLEYDTIFRIHSMTKPIVAIALMMLFEEGEFLLEDPISNYIPEFSNVEVFVKEEDGKLITTKSEREITILDLFTHTSGLSYGFFAENPIDNLYNERLTYEKTRSLPLEEVINVISSIPLRFHPGEYFNYSYSTDVLGRLIEVLSGQKLDQFLQERIFKPLEMVNTDFFVSDKDKTKFAKPYLYSADSKEIQLFTASSAYERFTKDYKFLSGGGGLVSTLNDYFNFTKMLLNKGKFKKIQILTPKTVELMTRNYLSENQTIGESQIEKLIELHDHGQGLGMRVRIKEGTFTPKIGEHGWMGIARTYYWVDPLNDIIGIFMTQVYPASPETIIFNREQILKLVYEGFHQ
ncbi:MAG: serine hydrolase domain-containing protein [Candidatus Heimdallarchaeaceae archaeon]